MVSIVLSNQVDRSIDLEKTSSRNVAQMVTDELTIDLPFAQDAAHTIKDASTKPMTDV